MHIAQCKKCLKTATIAGDGVDVHDAVDATGCACCPLDHHHGRAAGNAADGGTPCRPLVITLLGGPPDPAQVIQGTVVQGQLQLGAA
jgi:hypothetical protein